MMASNLVEECERFFFCPGAQVSTLPQNEIFVTSVDEIFQKLAWPDRQSISGLRFSPCQSRGKAINVEMFMAFSAKTKVRVLFRCYDGRKTIPLMSPMSPIRMYLLSPWDCTHGWLGAPLNSVSFRSLSFLSPPHKFILTFQIAFVKLDPSKQADLKLLLNESCLIIAGASDETRHVLLKLCGAEGVTDARNLWENEDGRRLVSGEKRGVDPLIPLRCEN